MSSVEKVDTSHDLRGDVEVLEMKCRDALLRNREIRMKMRSEMRRMEEERRMQEEEDEENIRRMLPVRRNRNKSPLKSRGSGSTRNSKLSTGQRLRVLHSNIWERLGKLEELRAQLKSCHIPKQTHRNVQHAVKDTELEIQKLQQQIEYLLQSKQTHLGKLDSHLKRSNISVETLMSIHDIIEKKTNPQQDDPV
uniref:Uncharacterized protein n=1 Tax=Ciona savignyi TaxID=51511 RepID=H2Y3V6_CIOSA